MLLLEKKEKEKRKALDKYAGRGYNKNNEFSFYRKEEMHMKIGMAWHAEIERDRQIRLLRENGFEATFLDSADPQLAEIAAAVREAGITPESCHAPFDGINALWAEDESGEGMLNRLIDSVRNCHKCGIPVLVVHLSSGDAAPRISDAGQARFDRLMEAAREAGVTIAFENQRKLANLANAMEQYPDAGFCWDVGHEACFARGVRFMPLFGKRIAALHLHDNHAEHNRDEHLLPYDGRIDLDLAARSLAEVGYEGAAMLEVTVYRDLSPEDYYARAAAAARRFADAVEAYRN